MCIRTCLLANLLAHRSGDCRDVRETLQLSNQDRRTFAFIDLEVTTVEDTNQRAVLIESSSEIQAPVRIENRTPHFTFEISQATNKLEEVVTDGSGAPSSGTRTVIPFTVPPQSSRGIARFDPHGSYTFDVRIPRLSLQSMFSISSSIGESEVRESRGLRFYMEQGVILLHFHLYA